jgi:imidazolonepropionase-like amidohydrolase
VSAPRLLSALLLAALAAGPARADDADEVGRTYVVRAGAVYAANAVYSPGLIFVQDGVITAVLPDQGDLPAWLPVVDRRHATVIPGLVAGQLELGSGRREAATLGARFLAVDGFDTYADQQALLAAGITTAFLHPGRGRLVTGRGAVVKLAGEPRRRVLVRVGDLCAELGEGALNPPPEVEIHLPSSSDVPIEPGRPQRPGSRLTLATELREQFGRALRYQEDRERLPASERPAFDPDLAALAEALLGNGLRLDARRAGELRGALALASELELRPLLVGATEIRELIPALAQLKWPVLYEVPLELTGTPRDRRGHPDRLAIRHDTPRRLHQAGIPFALNAPKGSGPRLRLLAATTVRHGLSPEQALAAITHHPARLLGVADRVGALEEGLDADFVVLNGDPLSARSAVLETWVSGRRVYQAPGARALVVRAGTILPAVGGPIRDGEVLIEAGAIAAVGSSVPHPPGARVIDAGPNGVVTPGFVDAYGHLGLQGDRDGAGAEIPLHVLVGRDHDALLTVARAGVTTVLTAPWKLAGAGSRVVALKTAESDLPDDVRHGLVLRETGGVAFDLTRMDPLEVPRSLIGRLRAGAAYAKKWEKYQAELERWRTAKKEESKPAPPSTDEGEDDSGETKVDPISGTWAYTVSGGPIPEPQPGEVKLLLESDGTTIRGIATSEQSPDEVPVRGTLEGTRVELVLEAETPMGEPRIEAELDAEDHMTGNVILGPFQLDFEASRTEREAPEIKIQARKRGRGGKPLPPPVDPALEPLRRAYAGEGALVLHVDDAASARTVLSRLKESGLKLVLVGLRDGDLLAEELRGAGSGVVLRPEARVSRGGHVASPAADLARAGVRLGFMSGAEDGAAELPLRTVVAVQHGLATGDALAALTIEAARLYGLDDRVGSLEVGKDGDLLVFDGPPFEPTSRLQAVVVGGRVVPAEED